MFTWIWREQEIGIEGSGELAISLGVLLQMTRFNEAEARAPRMQESHSPPDLLIFAAIARRSSKIYLVSFGVASNLTVSGG